MRDIKELIFAQPDSVILNKDKTSTLYWGKTETWQAYVYGGICWPILVGPKTHQRIQGFAVLVGFHIETGKHYVLDQYPFVTVEHCIGDDGLISHHGLGAFLNSCWKYYFATKFYYRQPGETHKKYLLEIVRSQSVNPKPLMIECQWDDDAIADQSVIEKAQLKKLAWEKGSLLDVAVSELIVDPDHASPEWNALRCAMVGFDRYPWRKLKGG